MGANYFDLQVNGYGGIDFNCDDLTADALHTACERLAHDDVAGILATFITEDLVVMRKRIARLVELRAQDPLAQQRIAGIHIEGPFISERDGFRGAHPKDAVVPAQRDAAAALVDAGEGLVKIFTLAPEADAGCAVTRYLSERSVVVSAGHTDASSDQLRAAVDAGLSMFTHLGNGCPMQMHRHDNIVQRALALADRITCCFIADGAHIAFPALGNYLRLAGLDRAVVVTDAIAPAGLGPGRFHISRWTLDIGPDLVARSPDGSHLVGSANHMHQVAHNLRTHLKLSETDIDRLTRTNPSRALSLPD